MKKTISLGNKGRLSIERTTGGLQFFVAIHDAQGRSAEVEHISLNDLKVIHRAVGEVIDDADDLVEYLKEKDVDVE